MTNRQCHIHVSDFVSYTNTWGDLCTGIVRRRYRDSELGVVYAIRCTTPEFSLVMVGPAQEDIAVSGEIEAVLPIESWIEKALDRYPLERVAAYVHRMGFHELIEGEVMIKLVTQYKELEGNK